MSTNVRLLVFVAAAILVAISTLGAIAAGQQYFLLKVAKDTALSHRMLEDTFLSTLDEDLSGPRLAQEVAAHKDRVKKVWLSAETLVTDLEAWTIVEFGGWCLALIFASLVLYLSRKGTTSAERVSENR